LLKETGKTVCRPTSTPVDQQDVVEDKEKYQRLVNRLIYLFYARLDIDFIVSIPGYASTKRRAFTSCP